MSDFDDTHENRGSWLREAREIENCWKRTTKSYSYNKLLAESEAPKKTLGGGHGKNQFVDSFSGISPYDPDVYGVSLPKEILCMAFAKSKRRRKHV